MTGEGLIKTAYYTRWRAGKTVVGRHKQFPLFTRGYRLSRRTIVILDFGNRRKRDLDDLAVRTFHFDAGRR